MLVLCVCVSWSAFLKSHTKVVFFCFKNFIEIDPNVLFSLCRAVLSSQMISYEMCHSLATNGSTHIIFAPYTFSFLSHASLKMRTTIIQIWSCNDTCVRAAPSALLSHFKKIFSFLLSIDIVVQLLPSIYNDPQCFWRRFFIFLKINWIFYDHLRPLNLL